MTNLPAETGSATRETAADGPLPGGDFRLFVQKLGYQALIALGVLENPLTRTRAAHLGQARGLIDDLRMLREKTRTNLDAAEEEHLERVIDELERHLGQLARRGEG